MAESHQEKVVRIIAERNGDGKGPLSASDRMDILLKMRDDSLCWAAGCAHSEVGKGSQASMGLYEFAALAIIQLENEAHAGASTRIPWAYTDYPLDGMGPEASDTVN